MISLQIITIDRKLADNMAEFLLKNHLVLETLIAENVISKELIKDEIVTKIKVQITGLTKALLFDKINNELNFHFNNCDFTIHSTPIVYMDWDRQTKLLQQVENI